MPSVRAMRLASFHEATDVDPGKWVSMPSVRAMRLASHGGWPISQV